MTDCEAFEKWWRNYAHLEAALSRQFCRDAWQACADHYKADAILALPELQEALRDAGQRMITGLTAVSSDPRYKGWVFVRHVDGENWTTCAKMSPETWAMIMPAIDAAKGER